MPRPHEEIVQMVGKGRVEVALELLGQLGQCKGGTVKLGEMIERAEGEDFPAVFALESYYKIVYGIYEELIGNWESNGNRIYKASMWDSLESLWQAANADPYCDAYVVPIPYYDRNQDRSLGAFHYEGNRFYSEQLKKYTELVYISYYFMVGDMADGQVFVRYMPMQIILSYRRKNIRN